MIDIIECYVYKPLMLLRIYGCKDILNKEEILVYQKNLYIGSAVQNIWISNKEKLARGGVNWVFTKILDNMEQGEKLLIRVVDKEKEYSYDLEICPIIRDEIPATFISNIGSKNNLTINEGKNIQDKFIKIQESYSYIPPLKYLAIESSSLCNLKCKYCIVSNNYNAIERCSMSKRVLDEAISIVNRLYDKGLQRIQLNALGEPLTNPNFIEIVRRIYLETKIRDILFFTNGMLFSEEISDFLADIPMNFQVFFSLDGNSAKENNNYRIGSDYEKVKQNLYYFLHKIAGKTNFTVRINNLQINSIEGKAKVPEFLLNDFGFLQIDSHRAFNFPELSRKKLKRNRILIYEQKEKKICQRLFHEATIRANGDIIRCHWDSTCEIVMGNILKDRFEDIWGGAEYVSYRKQMLYSSEVEQLPLVCQHCHAMNNGFLYKKRRFWESRY